MAKYRLKNTARNREVYHDGTRMINLAPGQESEGVELSDSAAKELRDRAANIKDHRGIVILDGARAAAPKK